MRYEQVTCTFCSGRRKDPFAVKSSLSTCSVCNGLGTILVRPPLSWCAHCGGRGAVKTSICAVCMGKGVIPRPLLPTVTCPVCLGSGDDASAPAMACLKCRGTGWIIDQGQEGEWSS